ncbi:mannitol dehydrogenase family protein [Actinoplanes sp. NPDC051494]|uniref:mannitol dehydrogenase family protein n=1 Tax=Actinoplanes sp. NPDC051494 TaxID=3363907 RepID=UPI0037B07EB1
MRLGHGTLARLPGASRPAITPGEVPTGIVHLGLGAFFRAHQAIYTEEAIAAGGGDWGITGVAPSSSGVLEALRGQDGLFSVTSRSAAGSDTRVIAAMSGLLHAPSAPDEVVRLLASPAVRVVTLTITEKGYADGAAMPSLLVRALIARYRADAGPIAVVSCDNLPSNGRYLRAVIERTVNRLGGGFTAGHPTGGAGGTSDGGIGDNKASGYRTDGSGTSGGGTSGGGTSDGGIGGRGGVGFRGDGGFREWLRTQVSFPGTMVDRIVPATTKETLAVASGALGVEDLAAVCGEPYRQWVIEDDFPGGRPAWELAGAVLTEDAQPWERLKLRTLNGVHSALAYLGAVAGRETIAQALAMPGMDALMRRLIAEDIAPSLVPPAGVTVAGYGASVLERFANPAIGHRTVQVAMDGSQKLPQRVLHTIMDRRAAGAEATWAALVVAAWMRFVQGIDDDGRPLLLDDPLAGRIRARLADGPSTPDGVVDSLLGLREIFPAEFAGDDTVRTALVTWLTALDKHGVEATVAGAA